MSHVTHVIESCCTNEWVIELIWMNRVILMKLVRISWVLMCTYYVHTRVCVTYEWVMSHMWMWMSHVTHMNESCHTWKMSHVTHMNESWHTYENMSELVGSHMPRVQILCVCVCVCVSHMNEICHKCEWVRSHMKNESCHKYEWVLSHMKILKISWVLTYHMCTYYVCVCAWMYHLWMGHVTHM